MFAVIFEVEPRPEQWDVYVGTAGELRPELERIDGFIENRRFRSRRRPGLVLSLSLWRDGAAVVRWREHAGHRLAQLKGRAEVFRNYRLRVGEVADGPGLPERTVLLIEQPQEEEPPPGWATWDLFDGLLDPADRLMLLAEAEAGAVIDPDARTRIVRVVRDYGMRDRAEAPQAMPPAPPA
ncbi:MAG TPA: antibiotic biosynthesis monooxygenase [Acetobacteraceae bacterium]|nr:antibiotic biosynthesis monooxygenase [Acetobacteraceae bacterium]